jgi:hypothetical protein
MERERERREGGRVREGERRGERGGREGGEEERKNT